ncbi:probable G-protein coupled receptor 139 isoform X2 [Pomacea canaliculata]|nr:probable G-protein coupled receptor 139 isoform X2 [Pomacea canaliculata]XP_025081518.1 probable G-protein coupled receptor 139 isoform X2 [Pomacea canaliculata]
MEAFLPVVNQTTLSSSQLFMNETSLAVTSAATALDTNMTSSLNVTGNGTMGDVDRNQTGSYGRYGAIEQFALFWAAYYINHYYLVVVAAVGFPGNLLSLFTILKMKPFTSPSIYVAALAISDNLCLIAKTFLLQLTKEDVNVGPAGCKTLYYMGNVFSIFSNWILVLMTVERFLAIRFPLKIGALCTRRRSMMTLVLLFVCVMALNIIYPVAAKDQINGNDWICIFGKEFDQLMEKVWYWVDAFFYSIIPSILLSILNTLIILGIRRATVIHRALTEDGGSRKTASGQAAEKVRQQRQITIMLFVLCVVFVVLTLPNSVFFVYQRYWDYSVSTYETAKYLFVKQIIFLLSDMPHAINFFVYFISTKKFRDRFLDTICCRLSRTRHVSSFTHTAHSQLSETGSIYVTGTSNNGVIPMHVRNGSRL